MNGSCRAYLFAPTSSRVACSTWLLILRLPALFPVQGQILGCSQGDTAPFLDRYLICCRHTMGKHQSRDIVQIQHPRAHASSRLEECLSHPARQLGALRVRHHFEPMSQTAMRITIFLCLRIMCVQSNYTPYKHRLSQGSHHNALETQRGQEIMASNGDTFSRNNPPRIIFAVQASITSGFIVPVRIH